MQEMLGYIRLAFVTPFRLTNLIYLVLVKNV